MTTRADTRPVCCACGGAAHMRLMVVRSNRTTHRLLCGQCLPQAVYWLKLFGLELYLEDA